MSELFDNYGLRVEISADYRYEDGRKIGQFNQQIFEPSLEDLLDAVLQLVEGCWGRGISRPELIEKIKDELDEIGKEYKTPAFKPLTEGEYD